MLPWIVTLLLGGGLTAFVLWVCGIVRENAKLDHMAKDQQARAESAEVAASVLVNGNWAERLRDKANRKSKD